MTLLITVFAAVVATVAWYRGAPKDVLMLRVLCWLYWGATLMWSVDAGFEIAELGADYFTPAAADMLNDAFLGLSVVALGLVIWMVALLVRDPRGAIRASLAGK